jgi:molybdopterin-guanine dinucleotide biosynthesis protein A
MMRVAGIVLCGGGSSRMGMPKAWLPFGDEVMLQRVVRVVREAVAPVVVVAAPGQDVPELPPKVEVVRDEEEGWGPLAGLAAGLAALEGRVDAAYLSSCDVPLLTPQFIERVVQHLSEKPTDGRPWAFGIAVPHIAGHFHPLAAAYRLAVLPHVRELLATGRRRLLDLLDVVPARRIEPDELADIDPEFRSLRDLDSPDEYEAALGELGEGERGA